MRVHSWADADIVHVSVSGELDMETAPAMDVALSNALKSPGVCSVQVDFTGVTFCDSSGIHSLDKAYAEAQKAAIQLRLVGVQQQVRRVLEIVDLWKTLTASDTGNS